MTVSPFKDRKKERVRLAGAQARLEGGRTQTLADSVAGKVGSGAPQTKAATWERQEKAVVQARYVTRISNPGFGLAPRV